ncbi:MAG: hypothetical protein RJB01_811 [Actinomycetota bacterium]
MRVGVIGAGISGIACATRLLDQGHDVHIFDRGRRIGGRMASRTLRDTKTDFDGRVVDYGASYFTISSNDFRAAMAPLLESGIVREWTDTFHVAEPEGIIGVKTGPMRYAAPGGLRTVVEALAEPLPTSACTFPHEVERVEASPSKYSIDGQPFDAVAMCVPVPQAGKCMAADLLPPRVNVWEPVIAVTMVFANRTWQELDGVFVNDDPVITWIADDGSRRGDGAPVVVAHVNPVLAAGHLQDPPAVIPFAIATVRKVLGISEYPDWSWAHRWSLAKPLPVPGPPDVPRSWIHPHMRLGFAGDAFSAEPRVEAAWLSGTELGDLLIR